jgi:hypothetical protein
VTYYIGVEDSAKDQTMEVLRWVMRKVSSEFDKEEKPFTDYTQRRLMNMMSGGTTAFVKENEVTRFAADIPHCKKVLKEGWLTTMDIHKLAMQLEFNRWPMEHDGRKGVALFPELSMFNHTCEANVRLEFRMTVEREYKVEARILRPVKAGEQLFISYFPDNDMALTRLARATRERWGFECNCPLCKSRIINMIAFLFVFIVFPILYPIRQRFFAKQSEKARNAGLL